MIQGVKYGARTIFGLPRLRLMWIGSWDHPSYSRFGFWRTGWHVSLRYRGYVLIVGGR